MCAARKPKASQPAGALVSITFTAHHDHRPCSPGGVVIATSACGVGGMCPLGVGAHPYRVAAGAGGLPRGVGGADGDALDARCGWLRGRGRGRGGGRGVLGEHYVSGPQPTRPSLEDPGGSCGCSPRGAAATVQIGHHRQSVPAASAPAGSDDPSRNQGSMRSSSASVSIRSWVTNSSTG